jgi:hypothetical protein
VAALALPRISVGAFESAGTSALRVECVAVARPGARKLESLMAPWGDFALEGDTLYAHIPDDMWAAEAILRVAWQVVTLRQGGVLMHGCAFSWGESGVAAIGESTAGKSTLAALSCGHPGHAKLLTDEIVQLFPDGTCWGTPFRSNLENVGSPGPTKLKSLLLLEKGDHEAISEVAPAAAMPKLLSQVFGAVVDIVPRGEITRRVMSAVDAVGVHKLTFRKDPAVGPFLRDWVST